MLRNFFNFAKNKNIETEAKDKEPVSAKDLTPEQALAQYIMSGILTNGFYGLASSQIRKLNQLCQKVDHRYLAQAALYTYKKAHMKEVPAYLLALLSLRDIELTKKIFPRIITNGRMLRNFTRIIRSGAIGRRGFGTALVHLLNDWINGLHDGELLRLYVGKNPTLRDILRLIHPRPNNDQREAFYGWICQLGSKHLGYDPEKLPPLVKALEAFTKGDLVPLSPEIPHELLISKSGYDAAQWEEIFKNCTWNQLRQSLNLFHRNGVFEHIENIDLTVEKLTHPDFIKSNKIYPQTFYASLSRMDPSLPSKIKEALHQALEMLFKAHLPDFKGRHVAVCLDLSSAMFASVTGYRGKATPKVHCAEIAAINAAMILKGNPENTLILPFATEVFPIVLNPEDPILTNMAHINAAKTACTDCSAPLGYLLDHALYPDVIILISDNESWIEPGRSDHGGSTQAYKYWQKIHAHHPNARLICWNLVPHSTPQFSNDTNILHLAGYSDHLFQVILRFSHLLPLKKGPTQEAVNFAEEINKISF